MRCMVKFKEERSSVKYMYHVYANPVVSTKTDSVKFMEGRPSVKYVYNEYANLLNTCITEIVNLQYNEKHAADTTFALPDIPW